MSRLDSFEKIDRYIDHAAKCFIWIFCTFWIPLVLFGILAGSSVVSIYDFGWFVGASLSIVAFGAIIAFIGPGEADETALASHGKQFDNKEES